MVIEGIQFCDLCGEVIFPDDGTAIKIKEKDGHSHRFHYHNRHNQNCLAQQIILLKRYFAPTIA